MEQQPLTARFLIQDAVFAEKFKPGPNEKTYILVADDREMTDKEYYMMGNNQLNWIRATVIIDAFIVVIISIILFLLLCKTSALRKALGLNEDETKAKQLDVEKADATVGVTVGTQK